MEKDKIYLASTAIELSEEEDKPYIELTNRLCYYGEANLNGVILPVEGAEEKAQTLINMPVIVILGKYAYRALDDYCKQKKQGKAPVFLSKNIELPQNVDYWQ